MSEVISSFKSLRAGSQVFALLMLSLCVIVHSMWSGKSMQLLCIFPFVVSKQFDILEFVFDSVYVDLQYDKISLTFTAGSVCLWCVCSPWSVCVVVMVPYVLGAVVTVTVMHVLLFVLHVCMLRECGGARVTSMLVWGPGDVWLR